jgi:hypothetical protein
MKIYIPATTSNIVSRKVKNNLTRMDLCTGSFPLTVCAIIRFKCARNMERGLLKFKSIKDFGERLEITVSVIRKCGIGILIVDQNSAPHLALGEGPNTPPPP